MRQFTQDKEDRTMRRRQRRIRRWFVLAATLVTLSFASSAPAMMVADNGGGNTAVHTQASAVANEASGGFNWSDAAIGAGIALGAAFSGAGILRVAGNRRRLAGLPH